MPLNDQSRDMLNQFYKNPYARQPKTEITDDWDERVLQAVEEWFTIRMNEAMKAKNQAGVSEVFSLTDSLRLLMKEAPGVEAFFIKSGADVFLKDEVELIVGWETDEEIAERVLREDAMTGHSFNELEYLRNAARK